MVWLAPTTHGTFALCTILCLLFARYQRGFSGAHTNCGFDARDFRKSARKRPFLTHTNCGTNVIERKFNEYRLLCYGTVISFQDYSLDKSTLVAHNHTHEDRCYFFLGLAAEREACNCFRKSLFMDANSFL